jgi:hypothetical protein
MAISFDLEDTNERTRKAIAGVKKIRQNLADSKEEAAKTFKKNTRQTWEPPVARRPPTNEAAIKMTEAAPRRLVTPLGVLHKGGEVSRTGWYQLREGEIVVPPNKTLQDILDREARGNDPDAAKTLGKGNLKCERPHIMAIDHNDDDSFQITHKFKSDKEPAKKDRKFSARNPRALVKHLKQVYGGE